MQALRIAAGRRSISAPTYAPISVPGGASSSSEISAPITGSLYGATVEMDSLGLQDLQWKQTSLSVRTGIGVSISGLGACTDLAWYAPENVNKRVGFTRHYRPLR